MTPLGFSVGIIGAGSMGGAIASGLINSGALPNSAVVVCDPDDAKRKIFDDLGCDTYALAEELTARDIDMVILAVKPQVLPDVVARLVDTLADRLVVSIAAGVQLEMLETLLPSSHVVRVMPNLPIQVRSGATAVCAGTRATTDDIERVRSLFLVLGACEVMREDQLDAEGAIISCGPAYIALFIDAFTRAGIRAGLPAAACREMFTATMAGVARQLLEEDVHPRTYMERVTSPGGTTAEGLKALEAAVVQGAYDAADAALRRTRELAG
jgi:pyrroline-5-carboxylate reductase